MYDIDAIGEVSLIDSSGDGYGGGSIAAAAPQWEQTFPAAASMPPPGRRPVDTERPLALAAALVDAMREIGQLPTALPTRLLFDDER